MTSRHPPGGTPPHTPTGTPLRADTIEQFAATLRALRITAGSPSFRTMSGRSHAISHTTLHEAAQGHRFPSWATTAEFVKACGADPAEFRDQWEQANQIVRANAIPPVGGDIDAVGTPPQERAEACDESTTSLDGDDGSARPAGHSYRRWRRRIALGAALAVVLAAGAAAIGVVASRGHTPHRHDAFAPQASPATRPLTAADCPIHQTNPPPASPPDPGDAGDFIADITLPDCSHVPSGSTVTKVWRFKNTGTVPWHGYVLHRIGQPQQRDQCQTITDVPIKDTSPGQMVDIQVMVTTPMAPTFCFVRFKMEDALGRIAFPGNRPVNFQLIVG